MKKLLSLITLVVCVIAFALPAQTATLEFALDVEFSGATPPAGTAPWITAIFDDSWGGDKNVRLTMTAGNLSGEEFIDDWFFNLDDTLDVTQLNFVLVGTPGSTPNNIDTGKNAYKADGDGFFDIKFDFQNAAGTGRFTTGETVIYDISYTSAITALSFNYGSAPGGGAGTYLSAAHIQGIGTDGLESGWIGTGTPVPEPTTMLLLGTGLVGLIVSQRKKSRK